MIDKFHRHVCRHAFLRDMKIQLERNGLWLNENRTYLYQTIDTYLQCKVAEEPNDMRRGSLSDIRSLLNNVLFFDRMFIDKNVIIRFMESSTNLSLGSIVTSRTAREAVDMFEAIWISQYGYLKAILADQALTSGVFKEYATKMGIKLLSFRCRCYKKNFAE